jgi:hypothetical protein
MEKGMVSVVVLKREIYGRDLYYPVNDIAHAFTKVANCKSLTKEQLKHVNAVLPVEVTFEIRGEE